MLTNIKKTHCFTVLLCLYLGGALCQEEKKDPDRRFLVDGQPRLVSWGQWSSYTSCVCSSGTKSRQRSCFEYEQPANGYRVVNENQCGAGGGYQLAVCTCRDSTGCGDLLPNCYEFGVYACKEPYLDWAKQNCAAFCNLCNGGVTTAAPVVHGAWSPWSTYSACSVTCGQGVVKRTRACNNPPPSNGGWPCVGDDKQSIPCYQKQCPAPVINGQFSAWTAIGQCSKTCGIGYRTKLRYCNSPAPSGGGSPCIGSSTTTEPCVIKVCAVDGGWGMWSMWTNCSVSCDLGVISRNRTCDHPKPSGGGAPCPENNREVHECSSGPCPVWSHWFNGDCSTSCGNGTMERLRHCSTGRDSDCVGQSLEMVPCTDILCAD